MGTVFVAVDESTGHRVALKRPGSNASGDTTRRKGRPADEGLGEFQREYALLAHLRHPSIVRAYDYGIDTTPYFTMELVGGRDLRTMGRRPFRIACEYVRDVASALALLHAQGLAHRDVSPRNVRVTTEGRAKLFDFGTVAFFGAAPDIAGTPSCAAPETLHGGLIDRRTDVFSLGSVLYWLLTGRDAFLARTFADRWRPGNGRIVVPPSRLTRSIPDSLDSLVASMVAWDPAFRPGSVVEVMDALEEIAGLPPEPRVNVARAYAESAKTVGRAAEVELMARCIDRGLSGGGGAALVEGGSGAGKTRFLHEAAVLARLRGATVLEVDGARSREEGLARALAEALIVACPSDPTSRALAHARHLREASSAFVERRAGRADALPSCERARRACTAVTMKLSEFAARRPLAVVIDDVDHLAEESLGLVRALSLAARGRRLALVSSARDAAECKATFSDSIALRPLGEDSIAELERSMLGHVGGDGRRVPGLLAKSAGNPRACVESIAALLRDERVRYASGPWQLDVKPLLEPPLECAG